ncbi:alpha-amylase family glycosyl hydrolase [Paenibacillus roseipurpureus]|uniref:Alpha-amylase family glycosyl hydrolase n=1 Tax=Paenibacillus roseopurpureus TaxID=2918901 RepID=A0AA96LM01_9BACL|nr:alpha-amylase family glycosyl hydrolase [Paenibacillus sp. MBLB1832]WNR43576.1 alpha-amylase family glycosyl hydrolase [Paenibacillus sp. MBLB1832]
MRGIAKRSRIGLLTLACVMLIVGCSKDMTKEPSNGNHGVFYEIFVRSFQDSNGDGIGDLNGVTAKLDYLKDLGIKGIWLTPIMTSPSYHGYDVSNYYEINPQFGTIADFQALTQEAHKRGIEVIMDLVVNHSSSENPWFVESSKDKNSPYRNWYTWAEDQGRPATGQSAAGDKAWHMKNGNHYLGIFSESMPDLNFDNPDVRKEIIKVGQFWLQKGADGFRLDAAKHVYEDFTDSKKDPKTSQKNVAWWKEFRAGLQEVNKDAYLVGEIWDSIAVIAPYLDHALNSGFNFDLAKTLISSANTETAGNIAFTLERTYGLYEKSSGGNFIDAPFLSNHDQTRVMSALQGNVDHAKMAAALLLTMPGNPFLYYGEEIGMLGMKPDEYLREPMVWKAAGGAGQTTWEAPRYNKEGAPNVEAQLKDANSLLNHYKKLIQWRNEEPALQGGKISEYKTSNTHIAAYVRGEGKDSLLVVHNLSGQEQVLDLSEDNVNTGYTKVKLSTSKGNKLDGGKLVVPAYSSLIVKK